MKKLHVSRRQFFKNQHQFQLPFGKVIFGKDEDVIELDEKHFDEIKRYSDIFKIEVVEVETKKVKAEEPKVEEVKEVEVVETPKEEPAEEPKEEPEADEKPAPKKTKKTKAVKDKE